MFTRTTKPRTALAFLLVLFLASCNKNADKSLVAPKADSQLEFIVAEMIGGPEDNMAKLRASSLSGSAPQQREEDIQHHFIENGAFRVTTSLVSEPVIANSSRPVVGHTAGVRMAALTTGPSTSILAKNTKYRVVLYDRSTSPSTFVSTTLGTAGAPLYIDVDKGKDYDWAVFSFNDENDPSDAQEVVTSDNRDLLYAKGTTGVIPGVSGDQKMYTVPINVQLQHKLSRVSIQVSAKEYPAKITDIGASLGRATYFCKNKLHIKTGDFVYQNTQIDMDEAIPFNFTEGDSVMVADYYTSKFAPISNFFITLNRLTIQPASGTARSLSAPVTYSWNDAIVPAQGRSVIAKINIQPVRDISGDKFKVLSIGDPHYTLSSTSPYSGSWKAMHSEKNFGPNGTYPTSNLNWAIDHKHVFSLTPADLSIYKMIFVGPGSALSSAAQANRLIDYVEKGGTVILFTGTPYAAYDRQVWQRFAGSQATATAYSGAGSAFNQHPILNGIFGDARGATFGNYPASGHGITNLSNAAEILAVSSSNSNNAVVWKAKDFDFYFVGSTGMQKYHPTLQTSVNPFLLTAVPDYIPQKATWTGLQNVSNSIMLMNIIAKTIDDTMTSNK